MASCTCRGSPAACVGLPVAAHGRSVAVRLSGIHGEALRTWYVPLMNLMITVQPTHQIADQGTLKVDFVVVDVETACSRVSSICQIGIVGFRDGKEVFAYGTLIDPCDDFSSFNTRIHGISCDHVVGKPTFAHVHEPIDRHLTGRITVAHSFFDKGALAAACRVHDRRTIETTWLDSVRVAKRAWPELSSHRLNVLTKFLGVRHEHHDSLSDA